MRRYGWLAFWIQLTLSIVSGVILLFSVAFTSQVRRAVGPHARRRRAQTAAAQGVGACPASPAHPPQPTRGKGHQPQYAAPAFAAPAASLRPPERPQGVAVLDPHWDPGRLPIHFLVRATSATASQPGIANGPAAYPGSRRRAKQPGCVSPGVSAAPAAAACRVRGAGSQSAKPPAKT
jgi:hypothetical protein